MTFWTDNTTEPKRQFRFLMDLTPSNSSEAIHSYYVRTVKKPQFQMDGTAEVKYIQHTFKYPGRITWQPIDITIIDPATPDSAAIMMNILASAGYSAPFSTLPTDQVKRSISKAGSNNAMGGVVLKQIDANGEPIEEWTLHNPFLTNVDFGTVGYDSDDLVEYTLTVDYDFATLKSRGTLVTNAVATKS